MEGFSSNLNDAFTSTRWCAEPMFFPQHILPLLPLYNAQWWGYESLTVIVLVPHNLHMWRHKLIKNTIQHKQSWSRLWPHSTQAGLSRKGHSLSLILYGMIYWNKRYHKGGSKRFEEILLKDQKKLWTYARQLN